MYNEDVTDTITEVDLSEGGEGEESSMPPTGAVSEFNAEELALICPGISDENAEEYCNTERYLELKALGLTSEEAFAATAKRRVSHDSRSHLSSSIGRSGTGSFQRMPEHELRSAREIFSGMNDAEIRRLYKKVTA